MAARGGSGAAMSRFWGTHLGKLDRKGRIAVPAPLRGALEAAGSTEIAFRLSHQHPCIEAHSGVAFQKMLDAIARLPMFDPDRVALETSIAAESHLSRVDTEGRLVLPEHLVMEAGLTEQIAFLGKGDRFEIWDAAAARAHIAESRAMLREKRLTLAAMPLNTNPGGMP
jgi:MraZ protein